MSDRKAVVLLSGGQDSTTCFYDALARYDEVHAVSFDYGQRHRVELELARETALHETGVSWTLLPLEALNKLGQATLTNERIDNTPGGAPAPSGWHAEHNLPPSFVPGRNLLFFTLAAAYGVSRGINTIVTGVCGTDHAGYPDCRATFVEAMQEAIARGMDVTGFRIDAPLLYLTKAETWQLADRLGVLDRIVNDTHTCYEGDRENLHAWGYGCGTCGACVERARGFEEFRAAAVV